MEQSLTQASPSYFLMRYFGLRNALLTRLFKLAFARRFAAFGSNAYVLLPEAIAGPENISIGADVVIGSRIWLVAKSLEEGQPVSLTIGEGCHLGRFNHIYATRRIDIGPKVLTGPNVYIADNTHSYEEPDVAVFEQPVLQLGDVSIGAGTWIGSGASIIGAHVGKNCVIGAAALVRSDIPDFCVAVGAPARIVKRYDHEKKLWRKCNPDGSFVKHLDEV